MNEYHQQAEEFLKRNGIEFKYTRLGATQKWGMIRFQYSIEMTRQTKTGRVIAFESPFYGSNADFQEGKQSIHPYDFLACISGNNFTSANEIVREFGSDAADMDIDGILEEARKIRRFFTPKMIDELSEIA